MVAAAAAAAAATVGLGFWIVMGGQQQQQKQRAALPPPPVVAMDAAACVADAMNCTNVGMEQYSAEAYAASIAQFDMAIDLFRAIPSSQMDCGDQIRTLLRNKSKAFGKVVASIPASPQGDEARAGALRDVIGCLDECLAHDPLFLRFLEERSRYESKCHTEVVLLAGGEEKAGDTGLEHLERAHFDLTRLAYLKRYSMNTSRPTKTSPVATVERKARELEIALVAKRAVSVCAAAKGAKARAEVALPCACQTEFFLAQFSTDSNFVHGVAVGHALDDLEATVEATSEALLRPATQRVERVRLLLRRQRAHKRLRNWGNRGAAGSDGPHGALFSDLVQARAHLLVLRAEPRDAGLDLLDPMERAEGVEAVIDLAMLLIVCVRKYLYTVTFHANLAHNLTRSP
jgi:hypothetical protein